MAAALPPDCSRYELTRSRVRELIAADRAIKDLERYLTSFGGARFDHLASRFSPNEFTDEDFQAVRSLNVNVLLQARRALLGDAKPEIQRLLSVIPADLDIWEVPRPKYGSQLGPSSPAWQLWQLLFDLQKGARRAGRGVTAGKLLHAKRPRLIPIFDQARIAKALSIDHQHFWEAIWCTLQDSGVRSRLNDIRDSVDQATGLSLLRVLDIIVWMSFEPSTKMNPQQVARAGEMFVAAEINKRGGYAVTFAGNMPGIDILASDLADNRLISIQVKSKSSGTWHARYPKDAIKSSRLPHETHFWIFVDLEGEHPAYYVAPQWWIRNNILEEHTAFLADYEKKHGHKRESSHHGIPVRRVEQWRDRWDILDIL
jgi:hypothetical protein